MFPELKNPNMHWYSQQWNTNCPLQCCTFCTFVCFDLEECNSGCRAGPVALVIPVSPCGPVIYMQATSWVRPTETDKALHPRPDYPVEHLGLIQQGTLIGGDNYASLFWDAAPFRRLDTRSLVRGFKINALFCFVSPHCYHPAS